MSLIEGIGDEVTILAICLLVVAVIIIAWSSTRVDVRTHTSVVIIDRERFGELLRRVRGIALSSSIAGDSDSNVPSHSSTAATAAHTATDSLLVSGAAASAQVKDNMAHSCHGDDGHQSCDGEHRCLHENEASSSRHNTGRSLPCESPSCVTSSKDCTESASMLHAAASAATDNENMSQHSSTTSNDMPPGSIEVRLQFVDGRQRTVFASPDDTIGHFKRSHFASELASNFMVRFIAGGQELKDETSTLRSHRIAFSGAVLHCLVTPARATTPPTDDRHNVGFHFDIGILMFPLFGTLLAGLWYARVVYRGYFNGTSTFSLLAISFLYIVALLASLRGGNRADQHPHIE